MTIGNGQLGNATAGARSAGFINSFWSFSWGSASLHPRLYADARSARYGFWSIHDLRL